MYYLITVQSKYNPNGTPMQFMVESDKLSDFVQTNLSDENVIVISSITVFNKE